MAVTTNNRFKFVSPGVSIQEIDNSQLPAEPATVGPVIIGRTQRGPGMVPVKINSFSDFVEIFGNPVPGNAAGDVWRDGNMTAPMYAAYAAQAWLKNSNALTVVRLLGHQSDNATTNGKAGWSMNGAYGVFVFSGSSTSLTGTLGAIIYANSGTSVYATGTSTINGGVPATYPSASHFKPDSNGNFSIVLTSSTISKPITFNFNQSSPFFIRNVINCNPTAVNSNISTTVTPYFLGESFEEYVNTNVFTSTPVPNNASIIVLPLQTNSYKKSATTSFSNTPWIFGQDTGPTGSFSTNNLTNLFRIIDLYSGESTQKNFKISIQDIKPAANPNIDPFGTFSVVVRKWDDNDAAPKFVEKYVNLNLNPQSPNYIAAVIGDQYLEWNDTDRNYRVKGDFPNNSKYIRVSVSDKVSLGQADAALLPFGFFSAPKFAAISGSSNITGSILTVNTPQSASGPSYLINYPELAFRADSSQGNLSSPTNAYFGVTYTKSNFVTPYTGFSDMIRPLADNISTTVTTQSAFTLDDVVNVSGVFTHSPGSRFTGNSITAQYSSSYLLETAKINRFTVPMYGGFDGLDITEMDPFNDRILGAATGDKNATSSPYFSIGKAIAAVSDPERVEMNLIAVPGVTDPGITGQLIDICEARTDALAVIDIPNIYIPKAQSTSNGPQFTLDSCVSTFKARALNSSYACTYYPWVKIVDTINGNQVWAPPSVAILGVFSSVDKKADPWFAPAGFTRGGLTEGAAGIPVSAVSEQLTSKQRDKLYDANINPIAQFPTEGIVVYGQKTLQVTRSALDRINVRRMLIYVKREISRIAATTLFEPNIRTTWEVFSGRCTSVLSAVKSRLGIDDFKLILDETTTTPDLVDRNIMYAKILLKPTKAIEFIAVDFVITNAGASFED